MSTFKELQQQIAELQREAQRIRDAEVAGLVASIKQAIKEYGLTPEDIFGRGRVRRGPRFSKAAKLAPWPADHQAQDAETETSSNCATDSR